MVSARSPCSGSIAGRRPDGPPDAGDGRVEAIRKITAEFPAARILALTTYEGDADIRRALDAGARGYLLKDMLLTDVITGIRAVCRGERVIPTRWPPGSPSFRSGATSPSGSSRSCSSWPGA